MSTILAKEIVQARRDLAKLLVENSSYELRNTQINSKTLFDGKIKEVAKAIYEAQQQRFFASRLHQIQLSNIKSLFLCQGLLKFLKSLLNSLGLNKHNHTGQKHKLNPSRQVTERISLRGVVTPNSSPPLKLPESQPFPLPVLPSLDIPVGGKIGPLCGTLGKIDRQQMGPLYRLKWFQDTIQVNSSCIVSSNKTEPIFLTVTSKRDRYPSPETGSGKVQDSGTPRFYSQLFLVPKKNGRLRPVIDLSLLNLYIKKQPFKMETVKSIRQLIVNNYWAVSIDLTDAYLHVLMHPQSRKYLQFLYEDQTFQFTALPFGMSLSLWIFTKLMDAIASHLHQRAISVFPYLDDWLIRNLIRNRLLDQTK